MCGISLILCTSSETLKELLQTSDDLIKKLKLRGPDDFQEISLNVESSFELTFFSSVLHLRGTTLEKQPLQDEEGNILQWNGEIFDGSLFQSSLSDTKTLSEKLFGCTNALEVLQVVESVGGPYSFVFYQKSLKRLWYGRDIFGRRSLLWNVGDSSFHLCSVAYGKQKWQEVPASGIFYLDLNEKWTGNNFVVNHFPWSTTASGLPMCPEKYNLNNADNLIFKTKDNSCLRNPLSRTLNRSLPSDEHIDHYSKITCEEKIRTFELFLQDSAYRSVVDTFENGLSDSVRKRVQNQLNLCKECYKLSCFSCKHASVGILFSGGLDSIVIAALAHRYIPEDLPIDLMNVAFASNEKLKNIKQRASAFDTPDRITGRDGVLALKKTCPLRQWNFIEVNVTEDMLVTQRNNRINQLLTPSCTVLDDSIGCAIWFAANGEGSIFSDGCYTSYKSQARVLLVGMGADEQLGGYSRHRAKYNNFGWEGLIDELALELDRIGSRNLGRDDRIISDNGVESRYPFLDEKVVSYLNELPVWLKMNLNLPRGFGEKLLLRLLAYKIGLTEAAALPKRAIQFGSRIARIENTKEKGSDICERLMKL